MQQTTFFEILQKALEIEDQNFSRETNLRELEEFDSLAIMALVALVDECFEKTLTQEELQKITTVESLIQIIGMEHFEEG